jgi:hypothetical protein
MTEPFGRPAPSGVLFPELLAPSEPAPAPPARPRGARLLKMVVRVLLWSLITVGAIRGLMPVPAGPAPPSAAPEGSIPAGQVPVGSGPAAPADLPDRRLAEAVAMAFLREYLTVGEDRAARAKRLSQLTAHGIDLHRSVSLPAGVTQYADLLVVAGSRSVPGGVEVTVVAHILQSRADIYTDGGTLAFVVPLAVRREGIAVTGPPRPTTVRVASQLSLPRPHAVPRSSSQVAERVAHEAVVAFVTNDTTALRRLGGGRMPSTRPLPSGWHALSVAPAKVTSPAGPLAAKVAGAGRLLAAGVPVGARPPTGPATYSLPVRVELEVGPQQVRVRQIDGGGSP